MQQQNMTNYHSSLGDNTITKENYIDKVVYSY